MDYTVHASLGEKQMEQEYDKKDMKGSPSTKVVAPEESEFPEGYAHYVKRGRHCVRGPDGLLKKFKTHNECIEYANG